MLHFGQILLGSIVFTSQNGKEHHFNYFCLHVINDSKIDCHLNLRKVKINQELYQCLIQTDINFLTLNPSNSDHWKNCKNDILNFYHDNWLEITQNNFLPIKISPYETKIFPMRLTKAGPHIYCIKINIILELGKKSYEYGLNRLKYYEIYINYLASYED